MVYFKIDTGSYFKFYFKRKAGGLEHTDCVSITKLLFGFMYIRVPAQCAQGLGEVTDHVRGCGD